jgi:protein SCO1
MKQAWKYDRDRRVSVRIRVATVVLGFGLVMIAGCRRQTKDATGAAGQSASQGEIKSFPIRGKIVSVDAKRGAVLLDHDAVPGFMEAMTMTYPLKDPTVASELHPGDSIAATLLVHKVADGYEDPKLDQIVVGEQAKPDYKPSTEYHVPQPGDIVPDFKLVNQNGRTIHLDQFRGKVILLTFIYTRCPLVDYCPRMSKNFAQVDGALKADAALYKQTHLLSISFDPEFDTPKLLKEYGGAYNGGDTKEFAHWEFAAPPERELDAVEQFFDLGVTPGESGTLNHSLSTVVIGKDGKVRAWYPTNEWTPEQALAQLKSAAGA